VDVSKLHWRLRGTRGRGRQAVRPQLAQKSGDFLHARNRPPELSILPQRCCRPLSVSAQNRPLLSASKPAILRSEISAYTACRGPVGLREVVDGESTQDGRDSFDTDSSGARLVPPANCT